MIDSFLNLDYKQFEVITDTIYGGVYDKFKCLINLEKVKIYTLVRRGKR